MGSPPAKRVKMADRTSRTVFTCSSNFATLANHGWYVDKTLLIKTVLCELPPKILITAPRRIGKSSNMDMIKRFVEIECNDKGERVILEKEEGFLKHTQSESDNFKLFMEKKIFTNENGFDKEFFTRHFGQYPVIYLNFKDVSGKTYDQVVSSLRDVVYYTYLQHGYLMNSDIWKTGELVESKPQFLNYFKKPNQSLEESDIIGSFKFLSTVLCAHFKGERNVYVFIDEFDAPIVMALYNKRVSYGAGVDDSEDDLDKVVNLIGHLISDLLKDNKCVERALLHASHHIGQVFLSLAHNISYYQFLVGEKDTKNLWNFYGFTGGEVEGLLKRVGIAEENRKQVEEFYNGYSFKWSEDESVQIYNTWSILNYLRARVLKSYWAVGSFSDLRTLLGQDQIKPKMVELMHSTKMCITINWLPKLNVAHIKALKKVLNTNRILTSEVHLFIQFLYEDGYLTVENKCGNELTLKIPNEEILDELHETLFEAELVSVSYGVNVQHIKYFLTSIEVLSREKNRKSVLQVANAIKELFSIKLPENEATFRAILFNSLYTKKHWRTVIEACTNETIQYRRDIAILIDNVIGIVIELKIFDTHTPGWALQQILEKKYYQILNKENIRDKIYLGIQMSKENESVKDVSITYLINDTVEKNADTVSTKALNLNEN